MRQDSEERDDIMQQSVVQPCRVYMRILCCHLDPRYTSRGWVEVGIAWVRRCRAFRVWYSKLLSVYRSALYCKALTLFFLSLALFSTET